MALRVSGFRPTFFKVLISDGGLRTGRRNSIIKWINNNVEGKWSYPDKGVFLFEIEEEAMAFKIVWSDEFSLKNLL